MSDSKKNRFGGVLIFSALLLVPLAAVAGWIVFKNQDPSDVEMKTIERWRNSEVKTVASDWSSGEDTYERFCSYKPDGQLVGCWIEKNGSPWSGNMVSWYQIHTKAKPDRGYGIPKAIQSYEEGTPHGTWQSFYVTGAVMTEVDIENGNRIETRMFSPDGKLLRRLKMK